VVRLVLELLLAPALVGAATLASGRWSARVGGLVSAFPAVVGPVLLITAQERGAAFTARTATGTLLGLVALAGFSVAYARAAMRMRWPGSLTVGWTCAALLGLLAQAIGSDVGLASALLCAGLALAVAHRALSALPRAATAMPVQDTGRGEPILRMAATTALVAGIAAGAQLLGPLLGGVLAGLPVLASVLTAFTHRREGPATVVALLRGMLVGMAAFVGFCAAIGLLIVPAGTAIAFAAATATAAVLQAVALAGVRGGAWRPRSLRRGEPRRPNGRDELAAPRIGSASADALLVQ
jgi:hypothetical protein